MLDIWTIFVWIQIRIHKVLFCSDIRGTFIFLSEAHSNKCLSLPTNTPRRKEQWNSEHFYLYSDSIDLEKKVWILLDSKSDSQLSFSQLFLIVVQIISVRIF
jgi:hypothetical protein